MMMAGSSAGCMAISAARFYFLFFIFSRFSFFAIISSLVLKNPCQRNERSPGTLMKILAAGLAQSQWIYIYIMFNSEFYH